MGAQDIGPETALQQVVVDEGVVPSLLAQGLVVLVVVEIATQIVIVSLMIDMMEGALVTEIAMTAEITNMEAVIAMLVTGTHRAEEIVLEAIGMGVQIVTHKMGTGGTENMIGKVAQGGAVTGMEVEGQHVTKEEATGTEQVLMSALRGEEADQRPLIATNLSFSSANFINFSDACKSAGIWMFVMFSVG